MQLPLYHDYFFVIIIAIITAQFIITIINIIIIIPAWISFLDYPIYLGLKDLLLLY
jgi:hypothetical protein